MKEKGVTDLLAPLRITLELEVLMSSLRRILSSRANGSRSGGPVTPEGKRRSAANSLRHGLLARCVVLENESREGFDALLSQFLDRFAPADGVEMGIVEEMLAALWRQRRAWAIETRLIDAATAEQPADRDGEELARLTAAFTALAGRPQLELVHRYETRLHNIFQRALYKLLLLRASPAVHPPLPNEPSPDSGHLLAADTLSDVPA
jgi:hypothetical protein